MYLLSDASRLTCMLGPMLPLLATMALAGGIGSSSVEARAKDWRMGPIVYQVFVDRFAPPENPEAKRALIRPPRVLMNWSDTPKQGKSLPALGLWSHELEFWGGDLKGLFGRLGYIEALGADVLYLMPIEKALTNHKYDPEDYNEVSPELGTRQDVVNLANTLHQRGLKLMLDGAFNHMGKSSPIFESAFNQRLSPYRDWFYFGDGYTGGYRGWAGVGNLPALRLENPAVRTYLWNGQQSVVRQWLRDGIDGWRLDVAFEIGPQYLRELTQAAHETKPGSDIVGEVSGYPSDWFPAVDGVFDFSMIQVGRLMLQGDIPGGRAGLILSHMALDAGIEHLLRSWLLVDNHDTPRLANQVPDLIDRRLIEAMHFTLPGAPVIYYGTELGMEGAGDPMNRAPMRWDLVSDSNPNLAWIRQLIAIRKSRPALRYGDFAALDTEKLLAYVRTTGKIGETTIVVVNPTSDPVKEIFATRVGRLLSWGQLKDVLTGKTMPSVNGLLTVDAPAKSVMILVPVMDKENGYTPYHRIN
jgi:glycosidase